MPTASNASREFDYSREGCELRNDSNKVKKEGSNEYETQIALSGRTGGTDAAATGDIGQSQRTVALRDGHARCGHGQCGHGIARPGCRHGLRQSRRHDPAQGVAANGGDTADLLQYQIRYPERHLRRRRWRQCGRSIPHGQPELCAQRVERSQTRFHRRILPGPGRQVRRYLGRSLLYTAGGFSHQPGQRRIRLQGKQLAVGWRRRVAGLRGTRRPDEH